MHDQSDAIYLMTFSAMRCELQIFMEMKALKFDDFFYVIFKFNNFPLLNNF